MKALEEWRTVPGSPVYEASRGGAIRSAKTGRRLKPWVHKSGHLYLRLGRGKSHQVHHLVLAAFGVERPSGLECRHLDGNAANNRLSNLKWGTRLENVHDLKATSGRFAQSLLSDQTALAVKQIFSGRHGEQTRIAKHLGVSLTTVNRLILGRTYAHLES